MEEIEGRKMSGRDILVLMQRFDCGAPMTQSIAGR